MLKSIRYITCIGLMLLSIIFLTDNSIEIDAEPISKHEILSYDVFDNIRHPNDIKSDKSYQELISIIHNIKMGDNITESLSSNTLKPMIYMFNNSFYIDYEKCRDYVIGLANKYDTYDKPRLFHTSDNQEIKIMPLESDTFKGYELDVDALTNKLILNIESGSSDTIDAIWLNKGMTLSGLNDIGDSYFEISLDEQHIWLYIDNKLIADTDVVTGLNNTEYETPKGIYYVRSLNQHYNMNYGEGSAICDYFILVTPNGIGIHDSKKREMFGGDIYKSNGSHGCINIPPDKAKLFFETLSNLKMSAIPVVIR